MLSPASKYPSRLLERPADPGMNTQVLKQNIKLRSTHNDYTKREVRRKRDLGFHDIPHHDDKRKRFMVSYSTRKTSSAVDLTRQKTEQYITKKEILKVCMSLISTIKTSTNVELVTVLNRCIALLLNRCIALLC
jgi:hypothetical protein